MLAAATLIGLRFARTLTRPLSALERRGGRSATATCTARAPDDRAARDPRGRRRVQRDGGAARRAARLAAGVRRRRLAPAADAARRPPPAAREPRARRRRRREAATSTPRSPRSSGSRGSSTACSRSRARTRRARRPEPVDLAELVGRAPRALVGEPAARDVTWLDGVPAGTDVALATPGALEQVLDNLLSNALAVSPPGSTITIAARDERPTVELHVGDQGPG